MRRTAQFAARLIIALGILLNGLNPAMAGSGGSRMAVHMAMMPGMKMGSSHSAPGKQKPCGGLDCGCCIGAAYAIPAVTQAGQDIPSSWPSDKRSYHTGFLIGITFPPDIRPPISRVLAA